MFLAVCRHSQALQRGLAGLRGSSLYLLCRWIEIEQAIYRQCTGRTQRPAKQPSEIYTIVGRRGVKSFISSLTACFIACFSEKKHYHVVNAFTLLLARLDALELRQNQSVQITADQRGY